MEELYRALMVLELSVFSWVLLCAVLLRKMLSGVMKLSEFKSVMTVFALAGVVFYPATLGLTLWDPYISGYLPVGLLGLVLLLSLYWIHQRYWVAIGTLFLSVAAHVFGIKNSSNLWDYIIDPFIVMWSWIYFLRLGWKKAYTGLFHEARARE